MNIKNLTNDLLSLFMNYPQLINQAEVNGSWMQDELASSIYKSIILQAKEQGNLMHPLKSLGVAKQMQSVYGQRIDNDYLWTIRDWFGSHHPKTAEQSVSQLAQMAQEAGQILHKHYLVRAFDYYTADLQRHGYTDSSDWTKMERIQDEMNNLGHSIVNKDDTTSRGIRRNIISLKKDTKRGIHTIKPIDEALGGNGLTKSSTTVIAAGTSVGKTTLSLELALLALKKDPKLSVDYFSLEMSSTQMIAKTVAFCSGLAHGGITNKIMINPYEYIERTAPNESAKYEMRAKIMSYLNAIQRLHLDGRLNFYKVRNFDQIVHLIKRDNSHHKGDYMPVIDYLGLISMSDRNLKDDPRLRTQHITHSLKSIAIECNCPILELSQLNRNVPTWKKPDLDSLRDSGAVEEDANNVFFLYRKSKKAHRDVRCLYCAKARDGQPGGTTMLHFNGDQGIFTPFKKKDYDKFDQDMENQQGNSGSQGNERQSNLDYWDRIH